MYQRVKNYNIQKKIGQGANGVILLALDDKNRKLALKVQPQISDYELTINKQIMGIKFQNAVNIIEQFSDNSGLIQYQIIVLEYCNNGDLYNYLQLYYNKLSNQHRRDMLFQIGFGIWELHQLNIIHRDIKPSNILISCLDQTNFTLKICDLGLSKSDYIPSLNTLNIGTPYYMAPEQIDPSQIKAIYDKSVDIWAFGALIYDFFSEKQLFYGSQFQQLLPQDSQIQGLKKKLEQKITDPLLLDIAIGCLSYEPSKRPKIEQVLVNLDESKFQIKSQQFKNENNLLQQIFTFQIPQMQIPDPQTRINDQQQFNQLPQQNQVQLNNGLQFSPQPQNNLQTFNPGNQIQQGQFNQIIDPIVQRQPNQIEQLNQQQYFNQIQFSNSQEQNKKVQESNQVDNQQQKQYSPPIQQDLCSSLNQQNQLEISAQDQNIQNKTLNIQSNQIDQTIQMQKSSYKSDTFIKNQVRLRTKLVDKNLIDGLCKNIEGGFTKEQVSNYINRELLGLLKNELLNFKFE